MSHGTQWRETTYKATALALLVPGYASGYLVLNRLMMDAPRPWDLSLPLEHRVPFIPELLATYGLAYLMVAVLALVIHGEKLVRHTVRAFATTCLLQLVCFALFPVRMTERPELLPDGTFWHDVGTFWFWLDRPTNLFPSAHVSMSVLSALFFRDVNPWLGRLAGGLAAFVAVSVVLVRQHYVLDTVAGAALALAVYRATSPGWVREVLWAHAPRATTSGK
ncbi:MAG: phosphatase PAP2 family protein [Myxococcota bacterium]